VEVLRRKRRLQQQQALQQTGQRARKKLRVRNRVKGEGRRTQQQQLWLGREGEVRWEQVTWWGSWGR
jgi:hypothetical protein